MTGYNPEDQELQPSYDDGSDGEGEAGLGSEMSQQNRDYLKDDDGVADGLDSGMEYSPESQQHEPFDFHNDPEALNALLPEGPALHPAQDASHPAAQSKLGKLWQIAGPMLKNAAMGAAFGSAGGSFGQGFNIAQQASINLQRLQMQRQATQALIEWRRAQAERQRLQNAGYPALQASKNSYYTSRASYIDAQTEKLKRAPNDRLLHSYDGADGKVHMIFQKPTGETYDRATDSSFYVHPQAQAKPILGHGPDHGIWLIDPITGHAKQVVAGKPNAPKRVATPAQFASVEQWKNREWGKVQNDVLLGDADKMRKLQEIQNQYERVITTLGGEPQHFDVQSHYAQTNSAPAIPSSQSDPWGLR